MILQSVFDVLYLFTEDGSCSHFEGETLKSRYLVSPESCTCPAGQRGIMCKHRQMLNGTFEGKPMNAWRAKEIVQLLHKSIGLPELQRVDYTRSVSSVTVKASIQAVGVKDGLVVKLEKLENGTPPAGQAQIPD